MNDEDGVEVTEENIEPLDDWTDDSTGTKWRLVRRDGSVCAEEQDGTGHWWRAGDAQTSVVAKELARVLVERGGA